MKVPTYVITLLNILNENGYEAYIVGGAVRSSLLGLPVHDYDITSSALPSEIKAVFKHCHTIDTGIEHGTVTVVMEHHPIEVTTYRLDSTYKDHRHPDTVCFTTSLREDCARRDFTINAMCWHPKEGILDFFHGKEDLDNRIIRCIGDPEKRFEEDALRILRAIRFAARLSFSIDPHTGEVLLEKKDTLSFVSIERIRDEFMGTLETKGCPMVMEDYREVFEVFLPEVKKLNESEYKHLCDLLEEESSMRQDIRLALLLHCLKTPEDAMQVLKRMKYSNTFSSTIKELLFAADKPIGTDIEMRLVLNRIQTDADTLLLFRKAIDPTLSLSGKQKQYASLTNDAFCWKIDQLEMKGKDLLSLGYTGKKIGETLQNLLLDVMYERCRNRKDELKKRIS